MGSLALAGCSTDARNQAGADEEPPRSELRIAILGPVSADPVGLNPTHPIDLLAADLLYDGLTRWDTSAKAPSPDLATSWGTTDGITWTFHLDPNRTFSNGSFVRPADVVASLKRAQSQRATNIGAARLDLVTDVVESGIDDVAITLSSPNYELPALLADPTFGILPADVSAAPQMSSSIAVSGRFKVQSGGPDGATLVSLDPVEDGHVESIELIHFDSAEEAAEAFRVGDVDIVPLGASDTAPTGSSEVVVSAANLVLELGAGNPPWSEPAARQALVHTIDRAAVAAATGNAARLADDLVPGGVLSPGACAGSCTPTKEGPAALTLLSSAIGPVHIDIPPRPQATAAAGELVRQLTVAGLQVERRDVDAAALGATVSSGTLSMALFAVVGATPSPDPYLAATLSSTGLENLSGYSSAEFDAGLAAARATVDPAARKAAYTQLEATALDAAPVIPLVVLGERFAVSANVRGVVPTVGRMFDVDEVRLG